MIAHLLFTIQAPLGAWGSASSPSAGQARKPTDIDPSRSAVVGLLAAALGWHRERLAQVDAAVWIAVRVDVPPTREAMPDFQTATPALAPPGASRWTRFQELRPHLAGTAQPGSIRSWREFWTDGCWTVGLVARGTGFPSLEQLRDALKLPRWPLFAGRKAFTLGLPPDPEIVEADQLVAAFGAYRPPWERHPALMTSFSRAAQAHRQRPNDRLLFDLGMPGAPEPDRQVVRRDRPDPSPLGAGVEGSWMLPRWRERTVAEAPLPRPGAAP